MGDCKACNALLLKATRSDPFPRQSRLPICPCELDGELWCPTDLARPRIRSLRTLLSVCAQVRSRQEHLAAVSVWPSTTSCSASKRSSELVPLTQVLISGTRSELLERIGSEQLLPGFYLAPQGVSLVGSEGTSTCRCSCRGSLMPLCLQ